MATTPLLRVPTHFAFALAMLAGAGAQPTAAAITRVVSQNEVIDLTGGPEGVSATDSYQGVGTGVSLSASATVGRLTAFSRTDIDVSLGQQSIDGSQGGGGAMTASFQDTVTLQHPGFVGQPGSANARIRYSLRAERALVAGSGSYFDDAAASISLVVANGQGSDFASVGGQTSSFVTSVSELNERNAVEMLVPFDFVYGQPFVIVAAVYAGSGFRSESRTFGGFGSASLPDSLDWLGLSGLPAGTTVDAAVDWSKPYTEFVVPEPAQLAALGLLPLLSARRRRAVGCAW